MKVNNPDEPISEDEFFNTLKAKLDTSSNSNDSAEKKEADNLNEILKNAYEIRKTELDLYWKRATYFWGFLIAIFAAHFIVVNEGNNSKFSENTKFIVICVGFVFSLAWYLVNRGSTYWLTNWERVIDTIESKLGKELYKLNLTNQNSVWEFWKYHAHSVSRINILVSFFVWVAWCGLMLNAVLKHYDIDVPSIHPEWKFIPALLGTLGISIFLVFGMKSSLDETYSFNRRKSKYDDIKIKKAMTDKKKLTKIILPLLVCIAIVIISSIIIYNINLNNMTSLGQLGDFIGGLLNPILAMINIGVLIYLTYKISDIDNERANQIIKAEKIVAINKMRQDAVSELIKHFNVFKDDKLFDYSQENFNRLYFSLNNFETHYGYLFKNLLTNKFKADNILTMQGSILQMQEDIKAGKLSETDKSNFLANFVSKRTQFLNELNQFVLKELEDIN